MKLNVYSEELTNLPIDIVRKLSSGIRYTGVRLNFGKEYDAVTIWAADNRLRDLRQLFDSAVEILDDLDAGHAPVIEQQGPSEHEGNLIE